MTINALSTWISAVQPRESWYLAGWINDTPIDFLVDPGDDILVFGSDFESALHSLELVLNRVAEYGLQLKSTKCNLFRTSVPFLGHIIGCAGLECDPNKLSAVANWIPPNTIKGVHEFLGFTGYYRLWHNP